MAVQQMKAYHAALALAAFALAACATVTTETRGSITVDGRSYPLITRTVDQGGRTYDYTVVVVKGLSEICLPDSPGDCKAAVRRIKNRFDRRER